jgi:hypothetical protein
MGLVTMLELAVRVLATLVKAARTATSIWQLCQDKRKRRHWPTFSKIQVGIPTV